MIIDGRISKVVVCIGGIIRFSNLIVIVGKFRLIMFLMKLVSRNIVRFMVSMVVFMLMRESRLGMIGKWLGMVGSGRLGIFSLLVFVCVGNVEYI